MKILLIDDDNLHLEALRSLLTDKGHEVVTACDGMDGMDKFQLKPDIVICDIMMPGCSGLDFINHVRNIATDPTPIIVLSSGMYGSIISEFYDVAIDDYLLKPATPNEIFSSIDRVLKAA